MAEEQSTQLLIGTRRQSESSPAPTAGGRSVGVAVEHKMSKRLRLPQRVGLHFLPFSAIL